MVPYNGPIEFKIRLLLSNLRYNDRLSPKYAYCYQNNDQSTSVPLILIKSIDLTCQVYSYQKARSYNDRSSPKYGYSDQNGTL